MRLDSTGHCTGGHRLQQCIKSTPSLETSSSQVSGPAHLLPQVWLRCSRSVMSSSCHLPPARGWLCWECYPEELSGSAQVFPAGSSVPKPVPPPRTKNISHRALRSSGAAEGCSGGLILPN